MYLFGFLIGGVLLGLVLGGAAQAIAMLFGVTGMWLALIGAIVWCLVSIVGLAAGCILQFK